MTNTCSEHPHRNVRGSHPARSRDLLGAACLGLGILGITLVLIGAASRVPWTIARFWLHSPPLLLLASVLLALAGGWLTWRRGHPRADWSPIAPGRRFQSALLYTRHDCGLCDEAAGMLAAYSAWLPPVVEVDIDTDPEFVRRFDTCVPVVELDGKVRFRGRISEPLLRRLIESTPPSDTDRRYTVANPTSP